MPPDLRFHNQKIVSVMNTKKINIDDCCDCSILNSYESVQNENPNTPDNSALQAVKLEILEKLIKDNKCPIGHDLNYKVD